VRGSATASIPMAIRQCSLDNGCMTQVPNDLRSNGSQRGLGIPNQHVSLPPWSPTIAY
jgi:hypothetical protein